MKKSKNKSMDLNGLFLNRGSFTTQNKFFESQLQNSI